LTDLEQHAVISMNAVQEAENPRQTPLFLF
jgi:hypothetical protein